ncbi:MAG: hypothetical protein JO021_15405, partial [Alphaproteobacteria bacterium]|nr:hypothetical protein [Alphaproteobacteria bacterium]
MPDNAKTTVAIIGAGISGLYLICELGILGGFALRLHDIDESKLADIRKSGGMEVEGRGFAAVELVTAELRTAIDGADVIVLCTGG